MNSFEISPEFLPLLREHKLDTFDAIMQCPAEHVMRSVPGRSTVRLPMGIYLKRYEPAYYPLWKRLCPHDEATQEWRATHALLHAGFNAPKPVASGRRGLRSFVMTLEIAGGIDAEATLLKRDTAGRHALLESIAQVSWRFLEAGFIHKDLYLRHIFVAGTELYFIDLQRAIGPAQFAQRWHVKDLAALAHSVSRLGLPDADLLPALRQCGGDEALWRRVEARMAWLNKRRPKYIGVWDNPEKSQAKY